MSRKDFNEVPLSNFSGFGVLAIIPFYLMLVGFLAFSGGFAVILAAFFGAVGFWLLGGFYVVQPNTAVVATFFGDYAGTESNSGFYWSNPFYSKSRISTKTINMDTPVMKVNDLKGNPIEIAAIVVWEVVGPSKAVFGVEDYAEFVKLQAESAIRQVASLHPYDSSETSVKSLRKNIKDIGDILTKTIDEHVEEAGIRVKESRISHLAYSQEIAAAMLKKQQAEAIVEARGTLVNGAVGIVEKALESLEKDKIVTLTDDQKAELVINLMTVLVGEAPVQPTVNMSPKR